jgi:hypothetical protein
MTEPLATEEHPVDQFKEMSTEDLNGLRGEKYQAIQALFALEAPTAAQVTEAEALGADLEAIDSILTERAAEAQAQADKFAALKTKFSEQPAEEGDEEEVEEEESTEDPHDPATAEPAEERNETPTPQARSRSVQRLAKRTPRPAAPAAEGTGPVTITAAADVPGFSTGKKIEGMAELAKAALNRMKGFTPPSGDGSREDLQKFGVAALSLDYADEFTIDRGTDDMEVLLRAANEGRLKSDQGEGSLVAAGGWCAPSETLYDLQADESLDGILSVPEVNVKRGGIRYTQGPQFADFYANAGFIQTEAQAIAGTTKPCYEVDCPDFEEVRLDAVGVCIKVPILTNAAYPELVQRFTSGTLIAHQHMVNANVIGRMVTIAGAARSFTGMGSTVDDTLEALELVAMQRRQKYRLAFNRSLEVVVPFWVKGAIRADLARRNGQDAAAVTDQQINSYFTSRNLQVSFVYDWQVLDETAEVYPATFQALVYPAGTFVKGTSDVINLSAVYDAASLAQNVYTGLFMEQGLLVAKMQYDADLVTLPICNAGQRGALNIECAPAV